MILRYWFKGLFSDFSYNPQSGLDIHKDDFYDNLINVVRTSGEKEIVVIIIGDFNVHGGHNAEDHEDQHGGCG